MFSCDGNNVKAAITVVKNMNLTVHTFEIKCCKYFNNNITTIIILLNII